MESRGELLVELAAAVCGNKDDDGRSDVSSELNEEQLEVVYKAEQLIVGEQDSAVEKHEHIVFEDGDSRCPSENSIFEDDTDRDSDYCPNNECVYSSGESDFEFNTFTPSSRKRRKSMLCKQSLRQVNNKEVNFTNIKRETEFKRIVPNPECGLVNLQECSDSENSIDVTETSATKKIKEKTTKNTSSSKKRIRGGVFARAIRQERKTNRNSGKEYTSAKGVLVKSRISKELKNCRMKCKDVLLKFHSEGKTYKEFIFEEYWGLKDHDKRVSFVCGLVDTLTPKVKRPRTEDVDKQKVRLCTYAFHFVINGRRVRVCKDCFTGTLGETNAFVNLSLHNRNTSVSGIVQNDQRGSCKPANKHSSEKIIAVQNHIESIPKYKSHYTRRETDKWCLPGHLNLSLLYDKYLETTKDPVSRKTYSDEFHKKNISFKKPKADTCYRCGILNTKVLVETEQSKRVIIQKDLTSHQEEADFVYEMKRNDKLLAKTNATWMKCYMFDLQQCLPTPCLTESVVFYKRQLWTFNLTMYDSTDSDVKCYMWHEGEGARGGNQIASCIYKELLSLSEDIKHVVLYSDACGGQNKNSHVAAMFLTVMQNKKSLKYIDHKFMVSGHSHLECDINHARIEEQKKRLQVPVYSPQDWYQVVRSTGPKNKKYKVFEMNHQDFLEFSKLLKGPLQLRKKDTEGNLFSWHEAKWFRYTRTHGKVLYKTSLKEDEEFKTLSFARRGKDDSMLEPKKCYLTKLSISEEKKRDLSSILNIIPPSYHQFYLDLKCCPKVQEVLPDIEDFPYE